MAKRSPRRNFSRALGVAALVSLLSTAGALAGGGGAVLAPGDPAVARGSTGAVATGEAQVEPVVTLRLRVSAKRPGFSAVSVTGTFRGPAGAGRSTYRLLPVGTATATHRHGAGATQRARIEKVVMDARSDRRFLRVVATGPAIGGPAIAGARGVCRRVVVRYSTRPAARTASLRWSCRSGGDESSTVHGDVLRTPGDVIASSYAITRRPCFHAHAGRAACVETPRASPRR